MGLQTAENGHGLAGNESLLSSQDKSADGSGRRAILGSGHEISSSIDSRLMVLVDTLRHESVRRGFGFSHHGWTRETPARVGLSHMTPHDRYILEQAIRTLCRIEAAKKPKRVYRKVKKVKVDRC